MILIPFVCFDILTSKKVLTIVSGIASSSMNTTHLLQRILRDVSLAIFALFLIGCATSVKENERDTDSTYRGFWGMTIGETPSISVVGSNRRGCWNPESAGSLQIAGGHVVARVNGYDLAGFVKPNGEFTAVLDLKKNWTFRLRGQLNAATGTGEGKLVHNRANEGLAGCTSNVEFRKTAI